MIEKYWSDVITVSLKYLYICIYLLHKSLWEGQVYTLSAALHIKLLICLFTVFTFAFNVLWYFFPYNLHFKLNKKEENLKEIMDINIYILKCFWETDAYFNRSITYQVISFICLLTVFTFVFKVFLYISPYNSHIRCSKNIVGNHEINYKFLKYLSKQSL